MLRPPDRQEERILALCEEAVARLASALPEREVACLLRYDDVLRHVAHAGKLRLIYEIPQEWGGVVWRAAELGATQLVEDVAADPDYLASDESVRSEIAAPVAVDADVVAVLDVESCDEPFARKDADLVAREAGRLGKELAPLFRRTRSGSSSTTRR